MRVFRVRGSELRARGHRRRIGARFAVRREGDVANARFTRRARRRQPRVARGRGDLDRSRRLVQKSTASH